MYWCVVFTLWFIFYFFLHIDVSFVCNSYYFQSAFTFFVRAGSNFKCIVFYVIKNKSGTKRVFCIASIHSERQFQRFCWHFFIYCFWLFQIRAKSNYVYKLDRCIINYAKDAFKSRFVVIQLKKSTFLWIQRNDWIMFKTLFV